LVQSNYIEMSVVSVLTARTSTYLGFIITVSLIRIIAAVRCPNCNGDFVSLGRHAWRCKARMTSSASVALVTPVQQLNSGIHSSDSVHGALNSPPAASTTDTETCLCGRKCKGRWGLKLHQRACGFLKSLGAGDLLVQALFEQACSLYELTPHPPTPLPPIVESYDFSITLPTSVNLDIKPGSKLPKTKERWAEVNTYFYALFALLNRF